MADGNPFQSMLNPNAARVGLYDMRMMQTANRMETPFERGMRAPRSRALESMAGGGTEPDYSAFTYDPAMRSRAIAAGVSPLEAGQVKQNVLLPNIGFFGNHPGLSSALEGGIFGALASHGGQTAGESIQGALEGIVGGQQARQNLYRRQFEGPFQAGRVIEDLQDKKQLRDLRAEDIEHLRAVNEHLKRGDDEKAQALMNTQRHQEAMEAIGVQRTEATAPRNLGEGRIGVFHPENLPLEGKSIDPTRPLWEIQQDPEWEKERQKDRAAARAQQGAGPWYTYTDPKTGETKSGRLREGVAPPPGAQLVQGDYAQRREDKQEAAATTARKQYLSSFKQPSDYARVLGYDNLDKYLNDPAARQKALEDYYDKNTARGLRPNPDGTFTYNPQ